MSFLFLFPCTSLHSKASSVYGRKYTAEGVGEGVDLTSKHHPVMQALNQKELQVPVTIFEASTQKYAAVTQPLVHSVSRVCMQTRKHRTLPTLVPMVGVPMFS